MAKKISFPLIDDFTTECSHMTMGSINCYRTYVNKVIEDYETANGVNLKDHYPYLEKNTYLWDQILQQIYSTEVKIGRRAPKYYCGLLCYMNFIGTIATKSRAKAPSALLAILNSSVQNCYSKNALRDIFLFRMQTQNRCNSTDPYYFPASLITQLDSRLFVSKQFDRFLKKEINEIKFLYEDNGVIKVCPLKKLDSISVQTNGKHYTWTIRMLKSTNNYTLYTVNPNVKNGLKWGTNYCTPMSKPTISKLVIDHDPEIAGYLQTTLNNFPRLQILKQEIDKTLSIGLFNSKGKKLPTTMQTNSVKKQQLSAVGRYWLQNNCVPRNLEKLMMDIEYLHSEIQLVMMDSTFNGNKNSGGVTISTLNPPADPNYLP